MAKETTYLLDCWWCTTIDLDADEKNLEGLSEGPGIAAREGEGAGQAETKSLVPGEVRTVRAATVRTLLNHVQSRNKCKQEAI